MGFARTRFSYRKDTALRVLSNNSPLVLACVERRRHLRSHPLRTRTEASVEDLNTRSKSADTTFNVHTDTASFVRTRFSYRKDNHKIVRVNTPSVVLAYVRGIWRGHSPPRSFEHDEQHPRHGSARQLNQSPEGHDLCRLVEKQERDKRPDVQKDRVSNIPLSLRSKDNGVPKNIVSVAPFDFQCTCPQEVDRLSRHICHRGPQADGHLA